jgi:PucR C-terminal helix-turn-helix domain/GGDEF-like domain
MAGEWLRALSPDCAMDRLAAASSRSVLAAAEASLGPGPVEWGIETAAGVAEKTSRQLPDLVAGPAGRLINRRSIEACVFAVLVGLARGKPADTFDVPAVATEGNRELVHRGVPLDHVLQSVWSAHAYTYTRLLTALRQHTDPICWDTESEFITDLSFAYVDKMTAGFAEHYVAERESWLSGVTAARRQVIDDILAGHPVDRAAAGRTLGLDLGHCHAAVIVWPERPDDFGDGAQLPVRRLATQLARDSGAVHTLVVYAGAAEAWCWLSWPREPSANLVSIVRKAWEETARGAVGSGLSAAIGSAGVDETGFRDSHLAAREAQRIGRALGDPGVHVYADVAVPALLTASPERAARFMRQMLGSLAGTDAKLAELRETLRLYLLYGRSRRQAAEKLFVAPNTVAYRVKRAEELLGSPLPEDHLPLRLALEIARVISPD